MKLFLSLVKSSFYIISKPDTGKAFSKLHFYDTDHVEKYLLKCTEFHLLSLEVSQTTYSIPRDVTAGHPDDLFGRFTDLFRMTLIDWNS